MSAPQFRPVWTCFPITEVDEEATRKNILRVWSNMHWTSVLPMMRQWTKTFFDTNKRRINWNTIMNITDVGEPLNDIPLTVGLGATSLIYKDTYDTIKGTSWVADDAILYWGAAAYMINPAAARFLVDRALPVDMHPDLFMHSVIRQHGWDFETSDGPYFTQYESNEGPFRTSVQLTDETDRSVNSYRY